MVAEQVGGDPKQIASGGDFAVSGGVGGEEADEAFLEKIVGQGGVAGGAREVGPERARRPLVEAGKGIAIHVRTGESGCVACERMRDGGFERHGPLLSHDTRLWGPLVRAFLWIVLSQV